MHNLINKYSKNHLFFIAEVGSSHLGSLDKVIETIDAFSKNGANIFKFQHVIADEILHPKTGVLRLLGKDVNLYNSFLDLEQDILFFKKIKNYCDQKGFLFFASSFGIKSSKDLVRIGLKHFKVASPESNYTQLLKYFNLQGDGIFLSTGVTELKDIEHSLSCIDKKKVFLMHCVTSYPSKEEDMNLLLLPSLKNYFQLPLVGLSDHSEDPLFIPSIAMVLSRLMGQSFILEKHITLNRLGDGLDDQISLLPKDVKTMYDNLLVIDKKVDENLNLFRKINPMDGIDERNKKEIVDIVFDILGDDRDRISKALGDGVKKLGETEKNNYKTTNRSYFAKRDIKKGEQLTHENIVFLRCEKNVTSGLNYQYDFILNKAVAKKDIKESDSISLENISF